MSALVWHTDNFTDTRWLGHPIWQNPLDAWLIQETIVEADVDLVVECGTSRGGSAYFMATLFDLLGRGHVITIDVASLAEIDHPRIDFVTGSSVDPDVVARVKERVAEIGADNTMVLLDSDHSAAHVLEELELYASLVALGGYVLVQDGSIDELRPARRQRPGPLRAIEQFVTQDARFEIDRSRSQKYLYSHSPSGWLRRVA